MLVRFVFTDSPPGCRMCHILTGVAYRIHDSEGNLIIYNDVGIEDLLPGKYCIYATKPYDMNRIYFAELAFSVPDYDITTTVYMTVIPYDEEKGLPEIPCPEMWPQEPQENGALLWVGVLLLLLMGGG